MTNDLISRSELKKAIKQGEGFSWDSHGEDDLCVRKKYIDNAPPVEAYPFEQVQELVKLNQQFAQEIENLKRPQGEWKEYDFKTCGGLGDWDYKCSNCEKIYGGKYNFCPNCGADMRKGEKK